MCRYLFRATEQEKQSIADNIVGFTNGTGNLSKEAYSFVLNWILTGPNEKTKAYFDIWVLASGDRDHILSGVFNQFLSEKSEPAE